MTSVPFPTAEEAAELRRLAAAADQGEWRAGRSDMISFSGDMDTPFKNVYVDDPNGELHRGERLPKTTARGEGDACVENAQLIAATRNALPSMLAAAEFALKAEAFLREHGETARNAIDVARISGFPAIATKRRFEDLLRSLPARDEAGRDV